MPAMRIARRFKFEASHRLEHHDGKCCRLHGHTYRLELVFTGAVRPPRAGDPQSGFVVDFGVLEEVVKGELIDAHLDHTHLNDAIPELPYTSAEYLSAWIMGWCMRHLEGRADMGGVTVERACLWETENAWAEADREDARRLGFAP